MKLARCIVYSLILFALLLSGCVTGSLVQDSVEITTPDTTIVVQNNVPENPHKNRRGLIAGFIFGTFTGVTGALAASSFTESDSNRDKAELAGKGMLITFPVGFVIGKFLGDRVPPRRLRSSAASDTLRTIVRLRAN